MRYDMVKQETESGENARFIKLSSAPIPNLLWKYTNPRTDRDALLRQKPLDTPESTHPTTLSTIP
jgi:hypothetical protein